MFIAPPGWEFSYYDMSQIEARIVAALAHIPVWLSQFEHARLHPGTYDAHCALASEMFKVPYDEFRPQDRDAEGKPTIRLLPNGADTASTIEWLQTVSQLSQDCRLSRLNRRIASTTWQPQRSACGGMTWLHSSEGTVLLQHALGRRWMLIEHWSEDALDSIVAFEPQSLNGDWTSAVSSTSVITIPSGHRLHAYSSTCMTRTSH